MSGKRVPASHAVFTWPVRVYYEDTDAGGVVYHANYLKFLERARTEWLRHLGYEQDDLRRRFGVLFVVTGLKLDYHKPARFNDELAVSVAILHRRRASLTFAQAVHRLDAEHARLCSAEVTAVCVDITSFKPQPWPQEIAAELQ
ncbi:MAG: tol-pal system-associated acyl-CoA thioesterase [Gammaproteobacteria bacterium]|nr:tol-pal system-associated acyl-CoA thioesterase [Gammaproteobacteria bacterium]